jgi:hypothetical protein
MRLLTDGQIMVMIVDDKPEILPIPLYPEHVGEDMDWEHQDDSITTLDQIKCQWPQIFDKKNLIYISNLKFVQIDLTTYKFDYRRYLDGTKPRPHFLDYAIELDRKPSYADGIDERLLN